MNVNKKRELMKKIRITAVILLSVMLLPCFISCSRIAALRGEKPKTTKYTNSDYHFSLVYPSYFSEIKETPSQENGDEYGIELINNKNDVIYIDISYKKASNLYEYAELSGFEKDKITPLSMDEFEHSVNSFAYDRRECPADEKPAYFIFASTKRMLYTVKYEFERGDKNADNVCETLKFDFDIYANVPKDNQFISPAYGIYNKTCYVSVPADYTVKLYPDPDNVPAVTVDEETGEVIRPNYSAYRRMQAYSEYGYFMLDLPENIEFSMPQLVSDETDDKLKPSVIELGDGKLTSISFEDKGSYKVENSVTYRKIYFTCIYNGKAASGTLTVGFTSGFRYFKSVYLIADDVTAAERQCYDDMLHSMKLA
ncbi:MAG: hypothetical protein IJT49_06370 [Clostridia bacterium]|nr:hypothetical protein [Clostridia bacterium]